MKYIVILGDGMADYPTEELNGKTPLEAAVKPTLDDLASRGEMGLCHTIPKGMAPGSDVANLSVMGYDPQRFYTGRSPLEAVSIGVDLKENDVSFRANLVTLSEEQSYEHKTMIDYSSDEISSAEGAQLIQSLADVLATDKIKLYPGISYRNLLVWEGGSTDCELIPPHDISDKQIQDYLPKGDGAETLTQMMKRSHEILMDHPVNLARMQKGLRPANSIWIWGQGKRPGLMNFKEKYGLNGAVISAVDLLKGIGHVAGLQVIEVEGATGNIHTNFAGKAKAALDALLGDCDFVYLHIEAPDESGHRHEIDNKVAAIEHIDAVTEYIKAGLDAAELDYSILLMPDHPTPLSLRTHTSDPVPYVIYRSTAEDVVKQQAYTEAAAAKTGIVCEVGYTLMDVFLNKA